MIKANPEKERHTIPRWNSINMAEKLGELSPIKTKHNNTNRVSESSLDLLLNNWKSERNLTLAIEIISTTRLTNSKKNIDEIIDFAEKAVSELNDTPKLLVDFLNHNEGINYYNTDTHQVSINKIKKALVNYPHNPLMWNELSREYVISGQNDKARKALQIAYGLAPENRTILRSIARFYTHIGDLEKALYFLRKCSIVKTDPWILSAEISITNMLGKASRNIKTARTIIEDDNYSPFSISELASELGTMDFFAGKSKLGKKMIKLAATKPFENAFAQMVWINRNVYSIENIIETIPVRIECNYEAQTRLYMQSQQWETAQTFAGLWQEYQPFSQDPAIISSFISSDFLLDYEKAKQSLKCGLKSNPNNVDLLNNYIYALILNGELIEAKKIYQQASNLDSGKKSVSLIATGGMLDYRLGKPQLGKTKYLEVIDILKKAKGNDKDTYFRALLCFAREEKLQGNSISNLLSEIEDSKYSQLREQYNLIISNYNLYN